MSRVLVLDHDRTRAALAPDALMDAVRAALIITGRDEASIPARIAALAPSGLLGAMPGYIPGLGLAGKLVSVFTRGDTGRSSHQGVVVLFDEIDGTPRAIMNADAITAVRTAAGATVAFEALAPPVVERIAVIGAGTQADAQLALLGHLDLDADVVVASRSARSAAALAERHGVGAALSVEQAVTGADAVFCGTDSSRPVVNHRWLSPHAHVSSVGGSRGPELDEETVAESSVFVEWIGAVTAPPPAGAHELQGIPADRVTLIGSVLAGDRPARVTNQMTVYKSTGYAALDVAAAATAYGVATDLGLGTWIDL